MGKPDVIFSVETHSSSGQNGWGIAIIQIPEGYTSIDVTLSQGSGAVYGYKDNSGSPYGDNLGGITTVQSTFYIAGYQRVGVRADGNNNGGATARLYG